MITINQLNLLICGEFGIQFVAIIVSQVYFILNIKKRMKKFQNTETNTERTTPAQPKKPAPRVLEHRALGAGACCESTGGA